MNVNIILTNSMKIGLVMLILLGIALAGMNHTALAGPTADIVYSARYYKPGKRPSYYKIWRINSAGFGRVQVTSGRTNDHSPIWLSDGKTILFIRETAKRRRLCMVGERGGPVTVLAYLPPQRYTFIESVAPNRRSVVYLVYDSEWKLVLFDLSTQQERALGPGFRTAWSPDSRRLYVTELTA